MQRKLWLLNHLTLKEAQLDLVFLPVGTLEAHSVLPLGTDTIIPQALCEKLAQRFNGLVAPPVYYGIVHSLAAYPGSVPVSTAVFLDYLKQILSGLARAGFKRLVVINGHGGHFDQLREAAFFAHQTHNLHTAVIHWWITCEPAAREIFGGVGGHGTLEEFAAIYAINPELVQKELLEKTIVHERKPGTVVYPSPGEAIIYQPEHIKYDFDLNKSPQFFQRCVDILTRELESIFAGWKRLP